MWSRRRPSRRFLDRSADFDEMHHACKLLVMDTMLSSELHRLAGELDALSERHWSTRDYTQERLFAALREVVASFPVYRQVRGQRRVDEVQDLRVRPDIGSARLAHRPVDVAPVLRRRAPFVDIGPIDRKRGSSSSWRVSEIGIMKRARSSGFISINV